MNILLWLLVATNIVMIYLYLRERFSHTLTKLCISRMFLKYKPSYEDFMQMNQINPEDLSSADRQTFKEDVKKFKDWDKHL